MAGVFHAASFRFPDFDADIDGVGPEAPSPEPTRGRRINAYKGYKTLKEFRGEPAFTAPIGSFDGYGY